MSEPRAGGAFVSAAWAQIRAWFRFSLAARLALIALVSTLVLVIAGLVAFAGFNRELTRLLIDPEIEAVLDSLTSNAEPAEGGGVDMRNPQLDPRYERPTSGRYFQVARIEPDGALDVGITSRSLFDVQIDLTEDDVRALEEGPANAAGVRYLDLSRGPDLEPLRIGARVLQFRGMEDRFLFFVAIAPNQILRPAADLLALAFAAFIAFCVGLVVAVSALQIAVGLEPLRRLRRDIADVRRGSAPRLERDYAAELAPLAMELNALIDHNREVVERARRHVGNLAHALKTPIAVLKNAAQQGGAEDDLVKQSVEEMEAYVERQLRRARVAARAESGAGAQAATIGYRTPVRDNLQDLVFMMEQKYDHQKALDIELIAEADATFRGEREDLLEMAANLIDNACKYGKSRVEVRLEPGQGMLDIIVEDDGPGLSEAEIGLVLKRGARLDEAAPGQGLGLSILTEAVSLYSGDLNFSRSALGGLKARLRLPATD